MNIFTQEESILFLASITLFLFAKDLRSQRFPELQPNYNTKYYRYKSFEAKRMKKPEFIHSGFRLLYYTFKEVRLFYIAVF